MASTREETGRIPPVFHPPRRSVCASWGAPVEGDAAARLRHQATRVYRLCKPPTSGIARTGPRLGRFDFARHGSVAVESEGVLKGTGRAYIGLDGRSGKVLEPIPAHRGVPTVVLTNGYDANGNRTSLSSTINGQGDFINTYGYDADRRETSVTQSAANTWYDYNSSGFDDGGYGGYGGGYGQTFETARSATKAMPWPTSRPISPIAPTAR